MVYKTGQTWEGRNGVQRKIFQIFDETGELEEVTSADKFNIRWGKPDKKPRAGATWCTEWNAWAKHAQLVEG